MTREQLYDLFKIGWLLRATEPPATVQRIPGNGLFKGEPK